MTKNDYLDRINDLEDRSLYNGKIHQSTIDIFEQIHDDLDLHSPDMPLDEIIGSLLYNVDNLLEICEKDLFDYSILSELKNILENKTDTEETIDAFNYDEITSETESKEMENFDQNYEMFRKYNLSITPTEYARYRHFTQRHRHDDVNKGAIGGHISMEFTFTSIANSVSCKCSVCGKTANITDYDSW